MGLLSNILFRKFDKKKEAEFDEEKEVELKSLDSKKMEFYKLDEKTIVAEYIEEKPDFKKFYDTTRVVIDTAPTLINGEQIYSARVSWYGKNDCVYWDNDGNELGRKNDMTDIKLGLDMQKLFSDQQYQETLMLDLLESKRVKKYMEWGLQETPQYECGNYIGEVGRSAKTGEYIKKFNTMIGRMVHYSHDMVTKRNEHKEEQKRIKEDAKRRKQEEIERLQREIDEL